MRNVAEYRDHAQKCRELAAKLTNDRDRFALHMMAETWEKLARDREAMLEQGGQTIILPVASR
jgi:hypothetical protein